MKPVIIACRTIEKELLSAMEQTDCSYPVRWLDSGLHNWPEKLRARIQELLDDCEGFDTVLLAMSFCGNSVVGLKTRNFQLVIPRCDDCITLLLGSLDRKLSHPGTFFFTEGWLKGERSIWTDRRELLEKYGEEDGEELFSMMMAHYRNVALLDTGCFDRAALVPKVTEMAELMKLNYIELEGTLENLIGLLSGNWDAKHFVLVPPDSTVSADMCTL